LVRLIVIDERGGKRSQHQEVKPDGEHEKAASVREAAEDSVQEPLTN
jgi:hypothetical protein